MKLTIIYEGLREEEEQEPDMILPERILGVLLEYAEPHTCRVRPLLLSSTGSLDDRAPQR